MSKFMELYGSPKYPEQLICTSTFRLVQLLLVPLKDGLVWDFHLAIHLGMVDRCKLMPNMKLGIEVLKSLVIKLSMTIVWGSLYW